VTAERISAKILAAGEVAAPTSGVVEAPGTSLGFVHKIDVDPVFLAPGRTDVAVCLGTHFGVQLLVEGAPHGQIVPLRTRVTHPPIANPKAEAAARIDEWDSPMNADIPRYTGWFFDNPWEIVPGHWQIEVLFAGKPIAAQGFEISPIDGCSQRPTLHPR
jgi:hypothetical protein